MPSVRCQISISLDGYAAGPNQSLENPLGEGGMRLHHWAFATEAWQAEHGRQGGERNADSEVVERAMAGVGAYIMGREMLGGGPGAWDEEWRGWWGEEPPFHARRSSCSPTTPASRWGCRAARRSTSSRTA
jgi:hypothetical protein